VIRTATFASVAFWLAASVARAAPPALAVVHGPSEMMELVQKESAAGQPLVVHFFATWCGPCREEMPTIRQLITRAKAKNARVVLFSLDEPIDATAKVPRFLAKHRIDAPAYLLDAPDSDAVTREIDPRWTASLPATFVFRDGKRTFSVRGPLKNARALDSALR
jgi:thiol-disulfide isomerase/thioredoxin